MYTWDSRVRFSEIGEDKRLTLDGILNYFQDSSTFHSEDIGNGMEVVESLKRVWVLSSWQIVVISNPALKEDFRYLIKQHGGMLAKGRLLGVQFDALFTDDLYMEISHHAISMADILREKLESLGYPFLVEPQSNQLFPIVPDAVLEELGKEYTFSEQTRVDESHRAVRFCTSWATREDQVEALCAKLRELA